MLVANFLNLFFIRFTSSGTQRNIVVEFVRLIFQIISPFLNRIMFVNGGDNFFL